MSDTASEVFNELLVIYYDDLTDLSLKLKLKRHYCDKWYKEKVNNNSYEFIDISDMPPIEGDEEVKEEK